MCRLFGCRTATPGAVAHELLHGANALRVQSREHPDGWGLGWYVGMGTTGRTDRYGTTRLDDSG